MTASNSGEMHIGASFENCMNNKKISQLSVLNTLLLGPHS